MVISLELKVLYSRVNEEEEGRGGGGQQKIGMLIKPFGTA